jgi:hypothetical protein
MALVHVLCYLAPDKSALPQRRYCLERFDPAARSSGPPKVLI